MHMQKIDIYIYIKENITPLKEMNMQTYGFHLCFISAYACREIKQI